MAKYVQSLIGLVLIMNNAASQKFVFYKNIKYYIQLALQLLQESKHLHFAPGTLPNWVLSAY